MTAPTRPLDKDLRLAYSRRDWNTLWTVGNTYLPAILNAMIRMGQLRHVDEDTRQQARLYVGEVVRTWAPADFAFSTHIVNGVTWRLRNWARKQPRLDIAPDEEPVDPDNVPYEDTPEGFTEPHAQAVSDERAHALRLAVDSLPEFSERYVLSCVYGLDGLRPMTVREFADGTGEARATVADRLERARQKLAWRLKDHSPEGKSK